MDNKGYVPEAQPPAYDSTTVPLAYPNVQPQPQPYLQPQPQPYVQSQPQPYVQPQPDHQAPAAMHSNVTVVAPQPQVMVAGDQVQDNMVIAIISIFFCCILGIIATIKASDSKESVRRGDIAMAERQSVSARKLAIAAIVIGCVSIGISILISIIIPLIAAASVASTYNNSY